MIEKVRMADAFAAIHDHWNPRVAGSVNDMHVKLVKLLGDFVWHLHENEDEMFLVVSGRLTMRLRDRDIQLDPGEFVIIPKGTEHLPVAARECSVLLFEPATTLNTGNIVNERTIREPLPLQPHA